MSNHNPHTATPSATMVRHAGSIDERRAKFRQDLLGIVKPKIIRTMSENANGEIEAVTNGRISNQERNNRSQCDLEHHYKERES